jgi:phosphatidylglycerophosphate synthase
MVRRKNDDNAKRRQADMLDNRLRETIDPWLNRMGGAIAARGVKANSVTLLAFALGMASAALIASGYALPALALMLLSRLCDGLDGAVARATKITDFGGYLDIVLDFAFYGAIPFAFILADPEQNAVAGALVIFSFYVNAASFLAFSAIAARRLMQQSGPLEKSLFFSVGLAEATETYLFFALVCLFPDAFALLAFMFAAIVFYTALSRLWLASRLLRDSDSART